MLRFQALLSADRQGNPKRSAINEEARRELTRKLLLAQTELVNDGLVAIGIVCLEIVQQATPLAD